MTGIAAFPYKESMSDRETYQQDAEQDRAAEAQDDRERSETDAAAAEAGPKCVNCGVRGAKLLGACRTRLYCNEACAAEDDNLRCAYSGCVTGLSVNPVTWPGDEGYCGAICLSLAQVDVTAARLRSGSFLASALGLR